MIEDRGRVKIRDARLGIYAVGSIAEVALVAFAVTSVVQREWTEAAIRGLILLLVYASGSFVVRLAREVRDRVAAR